MVKQRVDEAVEFAEASAEPDVESLGEHIYGDPNSAEQAARMAAGAPFGDQTLDQDSDHDDNALGDLLGRGGEVVEGEDVVDRG